MKKTITILFTFWCAMVSAQQTNLVFEQLYFQEDSMMQAAYEKKDVQNYQGHLDLLLAAYKQLTPEQQKNYKGFVSNAYYNLACTYALSGNKKGALKNLELSQYDDYEHLLEDSDLDAIRTEKRFKKCLAYAKKQSPDYLTTLKKAEKYNTAFNAVAQPFTYQSSDNPHLVALRKAFNLDSIAGGGNEISQILNLLHWIHNLVPHDGTHENPEVKNAMSMIAVCKKEGRGLNCRGLATVLNECYLSMGIPSRFVTCLPKDSADFDCHVINMVYSKTLQKWIWIDPTWDAYVMDEKGTLLGIQEVRERLIHDKPLLLNPDANWNHQLSATKEQYLGTYMAKNLYRLECALSSEYDYETKTPGKVRQYVELVPIDFDPLLPYEKVRNTRPNFSVVYTGSEWAFWAIPK